MDSKTGSHIRIVLLFVTVDIAHNIMVGNSLNVLGKNHIKSQKNGWHSMVAGIFSFTEAGTDVSKVEK